MLINIIMAILTRDRLEQLILDLDDIISAEAGDISLVGFHG